LPEEDFATGQTVTVKGEAAINGREQEPHPA